MGLSKKSNFLLDRAPQKSVNASRAALRLPAHDSGPGWLATPYLYDSCIRDFTPVYPGALQLVHHIRHTVNQMIFRQPVTKAWR